MHSNDGKDSMKASRKATHTNKIKVSGSVEEDYKQHEVGGNWTKKYRQSTKTPNGLKTVMPVFDEEEKNNKALIAAFQSTQTTGATTNLHIKVTNDPTPLIGYLQASLPSTSVKLQIILQKNKNEFILIHTLMRRELLNRNLIIT